MSLAEKAFRACRLPSKFQMVCKQVMPVRQETTKFLAGVGKTNASKFMVVHGTHETGKMTRIGQAVNQWCKKPNRAYVCIQHTLHARPIEALLDATRVHQLDDLSYWKTKLVVVYDARYHKILDNWTASNQLKHILDSKIPVLLVCETHDEAHTWAHYLGTKFMTNMCASESAKDYVVA